MVAQHVPDSNSGGTADLGIAGLPFTNDAIGFRAAKFKPLSELPLSEG